MSSESSMRSVVLEALKVLDAQAVENAVGEGTPDVNTTHGWIELKVLDAWPKRGGRVAVRHFRPAQRVWLRRRCATGGAAWLLIKVGQEWLLFWGAWAAAHLGTTTREEMQSHAVAYWPSGLNQVELVQCLTRATGRLN